MTELGTRTERNANVVVAVLGVITAFLAALAAFFAVTKSDVTEQRDDVQSQASTLATEQSTLKEEVATLRRENADLAERLKAASNDSAPTTDAASDFTVRRLSLPLPEDSLGLIGLFLDDGRVSSGGCCPDFYYKQQDATRRPQLVAEDDDLPYSTNVDSTAVSQEECSRAVTTSPTIAPIRPLHSGLLICVLTDGGTSLLRILAAPQEDGTLRISQKFWPKP